MSTLTETAYIYLINGDLEWLDKMPHSVEKMHIESILRCAHGQIRKFNVTSVFKPISHGLFIPGDKAWIIVNGVPTEIEIDGVDITPDTKEYFVHPLGLPNMKFTVPSSELFATRKEVKIDKNVWKTAPRGINELFDLSPVYDDTVSSK